MKFRRQASTILLTSSLALGLIGAAHGRTPIEFAQADVASPSTQRESGWEPEGHHVGSPPVHGHPFRCFSDSDCPNGFPCEGARPDEGRDGLCEYSGPTKLQPIHVPLTPHPSCLVDADCDPGRRCEGNRPAMGIRGACIASEAPRAGANTPKPPK